MKEAIWKPDQMTFWKRQNHGDLKKWLSRSGERGINKQSISRAQRTLFFFLRQSLVCNQADLSLLSAGIPGVYHHTECHCLRQLLKVLQYCNYGHTTIHVSTPRGCTTPSVNTSVNWPWLVDNGMSIWVHWLTNVILWHLKLIFGKAVGVWAESI
jgi:hypothetical protein